MPNPKDHPIQPQISDRFVAETKAHWTAMYRFALQMCRSAVEAEDILQTALVRALKYYGRFADRPDQTERGRLSWLLKITKNVYLDSRGRGSHQWMADLSALDQTDSRSGGLPDPQDEEAFFRAASTDEIKTALDRLNPVQRTILYLTSVGYETHEISELLDIPLGTVLSARARAIKRLRLEMGSEPRPSRS